MIKRVHGIVRGNAIFVQEELGLQDGHEVDIVIEAEGLETSQWGDGLKRCAGGLSDSWSEQDDEILRKIRLDRNQDSRAELR